MCPNRKMKKKCQTFWGVCLCWCMVALLRLRWGWDDSVVDVVPQLLFSPIPIQVRGPWGWGTQLGGCQLLSMRVARRSHWKSSRLGGQSGRSCLRVCIDHQPPPRDLNIQPEQNESITAVFICCSSGFTSSSQEFQNQNERALGQQNKHQTSEWDKKHE